jgi:hypothetical protein
MMEDATVDAHTWAEATYGSTMLSDRRRTTRAIRLADAFARNPKGSMPAQLGSPAASKAAYRFLESAKVTYERLMRPHLQQTMALIHKQPRVLLIQDTTEINYDHYPKTTGLGPLGPGNRSRGYLLQSVLAVCPTTKQVLGLAAQEPFLRQPAPKGETSKQRQKRDHRETQVWQRQVQAIGAPPPGCEYIHVGDRGSDIFALMRDCLDLECGFTIRVKHNRRVDLLVDQGETPVSPGSRRWSNQRPPTQGPPQYLFDVVKSWPSQDQQILTLDGNQKRKQRDATLCISSGTLRLWEPSGEYGKGERPMVVSVVRTWEPNPPEKCEPLEWLLLVSMEVQTLEQAWEKVQWYRMRWIDEDYHQCLKTGCRLEGRQLRTYEGLRTLLGFLAPLAVRLLQLRSMAWQDPDEVACEVLPVEVVKIVAHQAKVSAHQMTVRQCWHAIAQVGGYQGRKGDGEPGWQTLWKGWLYIQTLIEGVHLASELLRE